MTDLYFCYGTAIVIVGLILVRVVRRDFDPFAPIWLFLATYGQIYVVQAISHREYALRARGAEVVAAANFRSFWALLVFLAVYHCGAAKFVAKTLPKPPSSWSPGLVAILAPILAVWGLASAGFVLRMGGGAEIGAGETLLMQFPVFLLVAGALLIVTGRQPSQPRPIFTAAGVAIVALYGLIWMFNAKRSHSAFAVLVGSCAFYIPRLKRPGMLGMAVMAVGCMLAVTVAIGWRGTTKYEQSPAGFIQYLGDYDLKSILVNLSVAERDNDEAILTGEQPTKETEEMGGFWLMLDTVPEKSPYDYGASYLRIFSSYIPRLIWPDKPLFGRREWVLAWMAGSEQYRDENFTGPAIGLLGACQLNGGSIATAIVMAVLAMILRIAYDFYRWHAHLPWAQAWWAMTYYNAWLMPMNDDPFVWFYYLYGHTTLPPLVLLWVANKLITPRAM